MNYKQFDEIRILMAQIIEEQRLTNEKMDLILKAFKSWQAQDEHYHKKDLERKR